MSDLLILEDYATGALIEWRCPEQARKHSGLFVRIDPTLFRALRRARIKGPRGPDGRLSTGQYAKLMAGLDQFDQIHVKCGAQDAHIEPIEMFEESRRLPPGWKIIERDSHAGH